MKILAISDVASKALWCPQCRERLEGIDLILFLWGFTPRLSGISDQLYPCAHPLCPRQPRRSLRPAGARRLHLRGRRSLRLERTPGDGPGRLCPVQLGEPLPVHRKENAAPDCPTAAQGEAAGRHRSAVDPFPRPGASTTAMICPTQGFECFNSLLDELKPQWFVHGHIHLSYDCRLPRVCTHKGVTVINATERYTFEVPDFEDRPHRQNLLLPLLPHVVYPISQKRPAAQLLRGRAAGSLCMQAMGVTSG